MATRDDSLLSLTPNAGNSTPRTIAVDVALAQMVALRMCSWRTCIVSHRSAERRRLSDRPLSSIADTHPLVRLACSHASAFTLRTRPSSWLGWHHGRWGSRVLRGAVTPRFLGRYSDMLPELRCSSRACDGAFLALPNTSTAHCSTTWCRCGNVYSCTTVSQRQSHRRLRPRPARVSQRL
jgi:hypothetical protein